MQLTIEPEAQSPSKSFGPENAFKEIIRRACVRKKLSHHRLCKTFIIA